MSTEFGDMRTAYGNALIELGEQDKNIVVLGADTTDSLKTSGFGKIFPDRFFILKFFFCFAKNFWIFFNCCLPVIVGDYCPLMRLFC